MTSLRQSALRAWLECPAKFYQQYILGVEGIPSHHLEFGTDYHKAAENFHREEPYNAVMMADYPYSVDFFSSHNIEIPFVIPAKHPFTGEELSVPISGTIDAIRPHESLYDHKTSGKPYTQAKVDAPLGLEAYFGLDTTGIQATFYAWAWWLISGEILPFTFVVRRKNPGPRTAKFQTLTTTRTLEDFATLWSECKRMIDDVEWSIHYPCKCADKKHEIPAKVFWSQLDE